VRPDLGRLENDFGKERVNSGMTVRYYEKGRGDDDDFGVYQGAVRECPMDRGSASARLAPRPQKALRVRNVLAQGDPCEGVDRLLVDEVVVRPGLVEN
jgi:hypothetical protein